MSTPVGQLIDTRQFGAGLTAGVVVTLAILAIVLVSNPRRATLEGARPSVPGAIGLAFTLGTVAAIVYLVDVKPAVGPYTGRGRPGGRPGGGPGRGSW